MAALVAANVTVTNNELKILGQKRHVDVTITFGDSVLTYPSGGVPLPTFASFGLVRNLNYILISGNDSASGVFWKYDKTNQKLRAYRTPGFTPAGTNATVTGTVAAPTFTGAALAAHRHTIHFQTSAAANAVTAAANSLRTAAAAFDVVGVADSTGEGGVVDITGGTPAGTNSAPAFTGSAPAFTGTAIAVANLLEFLTSFAPAATTIYAEAVGW